KELVGWDPANVSWQRGLATSARLAARGLGAAGREDAALAALEESSEILRRLLAADPQSSDYRLELAATESELAGVLVVRAPDAARGAAGRAVESLEPIAAVEARTAGTRRVESRAHIELGRALAAQGRTAEATQAWSRALSVLPPAGPDEGISVTVARVYALLYLD